MQHPYPIQSEESPRDILAADFKSLDGGLPIRGGWGYTQSDACIIDKNDPLVDASLPFDGIGLEYVFVKLRTYEEMVIIRPHDDQFYDIEWKLLGQSLVSEGANHFDKLVFEITALSSSGWAELKAELEGLHGRSITSSSKRWEALKAEFEGAQGHATPNFDEQALEKKYQEKKVRFTREFWFDITSFYGKQRQR